MGAPGRKIRVLSLIKGLGRGGAEQLLVGALRYADRSRFDHYVAYLLPWKDALVKELHALDISVICLEGGHGVGWIPRLRQFVANNSVDVIHVHSPYAAVGARLILRSRPPALVYTEHNVWSRYSRATYWGNALTYRRNDHVFTVSDEVRRSVRYPLPLRRLRMPPVETLLHGLDPADVATWRGATSSLREFGVPEDARVVGTVANLKDHKGHLVLLDAASQIVSEMPAVRFILVGQGPREPEIRAAIRRLNLAEHVILAGFREDAPVLTTAFDVFALPSLHEGLPIALLEAMALGVPVVATSTGGTPEVVDPEANGLLVPPGDPDALAKALLRVLRDDGLGKRLGAAGAERAAEFDIRRSVGRMEDLYSALGS